MFIIKFNNMVKNKWIWGAFAVLVAVAFAGSDILSGGYGSEKGRDGSPGLLAGKPLDPVLYQEAARSFEIEAAFGFAEPEYDARDVWKRCAAYRKAQELGIVVSDAEVTDAILHSSQFNDRNGFRKEAYEGLLSAFRLSERQFENFLRYRMTLDRLRSFVSGRATSPDPLIPPMYAPPMPNVSPFVPASIVEERAQGRTASYVLSYACLSNEHAKADVTLSDDEIRDFWARHTNDLYRVPDRRTVAYVGFSAQGRDLPADRFEQACRDYFLEHEEEYDAAQTNAPAGPVEGFDEALFALVRADVEKAVRPIFSRDLACRAARDFARRFNPDYLRDGEPVPDFFATAAAEGMSVVTTRPFSADSAPVPQAVAAEFAEEVFRLGKPGEVTDLIGDPESAAMFYVAMLVGEEPAHFQPFEEVAEAVADLAAQQKAAEAFSADVERVHKTFMLGMEQGASFADLAATNGLEAVVGVPFSWAARTAADAPVPAPMAVSLAMIRLGPGDFCKEPIPTPDGVLFFQVVDRTPGEETNLAQQRIEQRYVYGLEYDAAVWEAWLDANLASMDPQPNTPFDQADDAVSGDDED